VDGEEEVTGDADTTGEPVADERSQKVRAEALYSCLLDAGFPVELGDMPGDQAYVAFTPDNPESWAASAQPGDEAPQYWAWGTVPPSDEVGEEFDKLYGILFAERSAYFASLPIEG
jgi:hypothetical protein